MNIREYKLKKYLIAALIIFALQTSVEAFDNIEFDPMYSTLDMESENYFQPSSTLANPDVKIREKKLSDDYDDGFDSVGRTHSELKDGDMPLFKRCRLILTKQAHKLVPSDDYPRATTENNPSFIDNIKFWNKKKKRTELVPNDTDQEGAIAQSIRSEVDAENTPSEDTLSLETGISEHVTEKELMLDAPNVNFDEESGDMVATGRPILYIPPQKAKVVADKMIYNQDSNILKGIGNVIVTKDGLPTKGEYMEIDMNEERMLMDNAETITNIMAVQAQKAIQENDKLILLNGNFHSDKSEIYRLSSRMVGPNFSNMILPEEAQNLDLFLGGAKGKIRLDIDKIYVDARKNHDKFTAKGIKVYRKDKYWFTWPSFTAYTDKEHTYFEANYPEFGSKRKLGMFIGPGFTFGGPAGSIVKVIPFLNYQHSDFGFGGALKYKNKFNDTELGYGTSANIFFLKGIQRLDDNLFLHYSANSFTDEWFIGSRMAKYMAELYYDKSFMYPNFLGENKGLTFRHRAGFGLMEDNDRNYYGEKYRSSGTTTTRLRYMAQLSQTLYSYENYEKQLYFAFRWVMQGSAALYGTGDTQFIARTGPRAHLQYKNWMQDIGYYQTGYDDNSPMRRYDAYRYGHSSLYLTEILRLGKYLSVGWSGMVNLSDDSPNGKLFQENRFVVAIGPDDLKIRIGYDFVRRTTYFGFDVAFDTKGTTVNYNRLEIKNPERLGKKEKNERALSFVPAAKEETKENKVSFKKSNEKQKTKPLE